MAETYVAGQSVPLDIVVTAPGGGPYDLTGKVLTFGLARERGDDVLVAKANAAGGGSSAQIEVLDAVNGSLRVYLLPANTAPLRGRYAWELAVEAGSDRYPVASGVLPFVGGMAPFVQAVETWTEAVGEIPVGAVDGVNTLFELAHEPNPGASLDFFIGGQRLAEGADFTRTGRFVTCLVAPTAGATKIADYRYTDSASVISVVSETSEVPAGTLDSVNAVFSLSLAPISLKLFRNGLRQVPGVHYNLAGATITFIAGFEPDAGDTLHATLRS